MATKNFTGSSTNVVAFPGCELPTQPKHRGCKPKQKKPVDKETVDMLMQLIERAMNGEINGLAFITVGHGKVKYYITGTARDSLIEVCGLLGLFQHRLYRIELNK